MFILSNESISSIRVTTNLGHIPTPCNTTYTSTGRGAKQAACFLSLCRAFFKHNNEQEMLQRNSAHPTKSSINNETSPKIQFKRTPSPLRVFHKRFRRILTTTPSKYESTSVKDDLFSRKKLDTYQVLAILSEVCVSLTAQSINTKFVV